MTDYNLAERLYLEFMTFRREFLDEALHRAEYTITSRYGEVFRPVVLLQPDEHSTYSAKIQKWVDYAEKLEEFPDLHIPPQIFKPYPKMISGATRVRVYELDAVTVRNWPVSKVIDAMQAKIRRSREKPECVELCAQLHKEIEYLTTLPGDARMYMRREGFKDTIANIAYEGSTELELERVSSHGLFIVDNSQLKLSTKTTRERESTSPYDLIDGIPTVMWPDTKLYLVEEVEKVRERLAAYREKNKRQLRAASERKSRQKRMMKDAVAGTASSKREGS
ncbi:hypothetical protein [Leclercia adecarboxylata]|uniref:hypothetical protein n=1 Tax=Leclercia adecarboxylata TaxID=83655 RepID=UPI0013CA50CE|nr:hypothetical protein [Leclercia adecarboxylata]NEG94114.1 hypothetical protein [Leclercia adecarboxylata]